MNEEYVRQDTAKAIRAYISNQVVGSMEKQTSLEERMCADLKSLVLFSVEENIEELIGASINAPTPLVGMLAEQLVNRAISKLVKSGRYDIEESAVRYVTSHYDDNGEFIRQ